MILQIEKIILYNNHILFGRLFKENLMNMLNLLQTNEIEFLKEFYSYLQTTDNDDWQTGIIDRN